MWNKVWFNSELAINWFLLSAGSVNALPSQKPYNFADCYLSYGRERRVKRQDEEESSRRNVDHSNDCCCHGNQLEEREVIARAISPLVIELVVSFHGKCDQDNMTQSPSWLQVPWKKNYAQVIKRTALHSVFKHYSYGVGWISRHNVMCSIVPAMGPTIQEAQPYSRNNFAGWRGPYCK